jgi:L-fuculose-phosphate aldolase
MAKERQTRNDIVGFARMMHGCGYVAGMDGNLSVRLDAGRILVTPTAMSKGMLRGSDLVIVDLEGRKLNGRRNVSSEIGMHLLIYSMRPDIRAVVHAHPPTATGFAASGMALTQPLICELVIGLGCVPLAKYGTPGTPELADGLSPLIPQYDAILMANHGVVTYGESLLQAYMKMETVEHFARVALVARILGHEQPLNDVDIEKLVAARKNYAGAKSAASMPPAPHNGDNRNGSRPAGRPRESTHKISSTRSVR